MAHKGHATTLLASSLADAGETASKALPVLWWRPLARADPPQAVKGQMSRLVLGAEVYCSIAGIF